VNRAIVRKIPSYLFRIVNVIQFVPIVSVCMAHEIANNFRLMIFGGKQNLKIVIVQTPTKGQ